MPHDQPRLAVHAADDHRFELIHAPAAGTAVVLFLPGMGIAARHYIPLARALAERGIETFVHEWRGNGSSSIRAGRDGDWGYRELIDIDLAAARAVVAEAAGDRTLILAGHSLGAQLACLSAARDPERIAGLALIAGGAPYWRAYPWPMKGLLPLVFAGFRTISALRGYYPGKRLGFAGNEARGVIADWAASGRTGEYRPAGMNPAPEDRLAALALPVVAVGMADDRFAPRSSMDWLTGKLSGCRIEHSVLDRTALGGPADHFGWMEAPEPVAQVTARWARTVQ